MKIKINHILTGALLLTGLASCSTDGFDIDGTKSEDVTLSFGLATESELTANTRIFQFHSETNGNGAYRKSPDLTLVDNHKFTFNLGEGRWDFTLVSAKESGTMDYISDPEYGKRPEECTMFENTLTKADGSLADYPELYTTRIKDVELSGHWEVTDEAAGKSEFVLDHDYNYDAQYTRNVAKVIVRFGRSGDLDVNGDHHIEITNVPTTLDYRGCLYPSKDHPAVSDVPLRGDFTLEQYLPSNPDSLRGSNELEYIIPAHRGSDYASPATATDTTTSLLRMNVNLKDKDGSRIIKNELLLPRSPKMNGIYIVTLSYNKRKLAIESDIIPWQEDNANADIANRTIITDKTEIGLSYKDTLHVQAKGDFTVTRAADASWITVRNLGAGKWEIEANRDTYTPGSPRSSYISVTNGNVEKRIPVTQRPEKGTIDVVINNPGANETAKTCWVSPPHPNKEVRVHTTGGGWKILPNLRTNTQSSPTVGTSTATVTRKNDNEIDFSDFNTAFGKGPVVFMNINTLDTDTIYMDNLYIGLADDIVELEQPDGSTYKDITTDLISVYGGSRDVTVTDYPDFVTKDSRYTYYDKNTGLFHFRSLNNPSGDDRYDTITLSHKYDPDYTVTLWLDQVIMVNTPEFDWFLVTFTWGATSPDVDITVGFENIPRTQDYHGQTFTMPYVDNLNNKYCGYGWNYSGTILQWGGDNTNAAAGESVYFNAKEVNKLPYPGMKRIPDNMKNKMIPRVIQLNCKAGWYGSSSKSGTITCTVYFYQGGTPTWNNKVCTINGGTLVMSQQKTFNNETAGHRPGKQFARINYDRKRHTAKFTLG